MERFPKIFFVIPVIMFSCFSVLLVSDDTYSAYGDDLPYGVVKLQNRGWIGAGNNCVDTGETIFQAQGDPAVYEHTEKIYNCTNNKDIGNGDGEGEILNWKNSGFNIYCVDIWHHTIIDVQGAPTPNDFSYSYCATNTATLKNNVSEISSTQSLDTTPEGSDDNTAGDTCGDGELLGWIFCPLARTVTGMVNALVNDLLLPMLQWRVFVS